MAFDFGFMFRTFLLALRGLPVTLELTGIALLISMPLGLLMAIVNRSHVPVASQLIKVYISFMRGTPLIVQIFLLYNSLPTALNILFKAAHIPFNVFHINNIFYALVVFSLSETAVLEEVFRSALSTVDQGQMEAANTVGLTTFQGYTRIVIPQALVSAVPVLCNAVIDLVKATSLAFSMSVMDMTAIAKIQAAMKLSYIEAYMSIFLLYLMLILIIEQIFRMVEKRLRIYRAA